MTLKEYLEKHNITQKDLIVRSGVARSSVNSLTRGVTVGTVVHREKISKALNLTMEELAEMLPKQIKNGESVVDGSLRCKRCANEIKNSDSDLCSGCYARFLDTRNWE